MRIACRLVPVLVLAAQTGCQKGFRPLQVGQRVNAKRFCPDHRRINAHAKFKKPELFETLALFKHPARQVHIASQRLPSVGIFF